MLFIMEGSFTSRNVVDDSRNLEFAAGNLEFIGNLEMQNLEFVTVHVVIFV